VQPHRVAYMLGSLCMETGIRDFSLDGIVDSTFPLTGNNYEGIRFIFFPERLAKKASIQIDHKT